MKNRLSSIAFVSVLLLLSFLTACNNAPDATSKAAEQPPLEITAVKLLAAYEADEPAAEKMFGGRNLVITGEVMSIDKKDNGTIEILLNSPESSIGSVRCHFSAEQAAALANIQRNDKVVVKGVCANMDSHVQVVVRDCQLSSSGVAGNPGTTTPPAAAKPKDEPNNIKALEEINSEILPVESFITDAGILYVSTTDEKNPLDKYVNAIRAILRKNKSSVRWIKVIEVNTANPSDTAEPYGRVLKELKW